MLKFNKIYDLFKSNSFQFWLLFILIILLRFWPFFQGKTLVFGDNYSLLVPVRLFTADWLKQGVLPLWNPLNFAGIPWLGDINPLYPGIWSFVIFPPALALNLTVIGHLLISYAGMYLLAKAWLKKHAWAIISAVFWMLSTQITGSINNLATLQSIVWLPWLSYFGLQVVRQPRARWWFALVVLLQFLGGYPQHILYGVSLAVLFSAFINWRQITFKNWLSAWIITALAVFSLSAVAWLPFVDLLVRSTRTLQTSAQASVGSLHPVMFIKFILPYFFDNASAGMKWGPVWSGQLNAGIYMTWLGWLAVGSSLFNKNIRKNILKKEVWFFAVLTLITLVISLGQYLPGFMFLQNALPFLRVARYPSMMMILTNIILALWTARALQNWTLTRVAKKWLLSLGGVSLGVGLLGWWITQTDFESLWNAVNSFASFSLSNSPFHTLERDKIIMFEIVKNIVFNSFFLLASIFVFSKIKRWWAPFVLVFIISLDLIFNTHGQFFFAPNKIYDTQSSFVQNLRSQTAITHSGFEQRLLTRNFNVPYTDFGSYWEALVVRAPFSDSFVDERELQEFNHVQALRDGQTPNWNIVYGLPTISGYTTLLPHDYAAIWNKDGEPSINFITMVDPADSLLDDWAVKYYLVDTWFKIDEDLSQFPLVAKFDRWEILERKYAKKRIRFGDDSAAELIEFQENPNSMSFSLENSDHQSTLIIADRFDPDWQAKINGSPVKIENHQGMRRISLTSGVNQIELRYWPKWFYLGLGITLMSGLIMIYQLRKK
ncbi:MAG: hypothetical protein A2383_01050 [Candidatus Pacebacteria bacterium RIFOXYB1_FULL_39_46]|nr:MAG: hypothetical protein A2182_00885 [Candidatus Pacebacteria bacterium RIFOXYA1_FULL_38_18]OGJ38168.1 MAG: hypothetical protein A2383_01050 [Candidatus Pacebacteria bacterium RIFOXYB1_FULL_39_46]OGJ39611.1 MAG: hypothetical protein A2411_02390 [Candidatus Pacebacteria bacterium RIFOXYC1_FULL_39_21]OGJ39920.1 MAG: hypothetical protein A2582_00815 [Candidatus Pacebacteria bacterium RIFOXYD1_FULL_39_27]